MTLSDRIAARQAGKTAATSQAPSTDVPRTARAFREALSEAGEFDSAYKTAFEEASNVAEKSRIVLEYVRLHPKHAAKSQWLPTALDIATHLAGAGARQRRSKWDHLSPDVPRRREIIRDNPKCSAEEYCELFDSNRIGLPPNWEEEFHTTKWKEVFKDKKGRQRIHRMICEDHKEA